MKDIKIWYDGMDGRFDPQKNFLSDILSKHFNIILDSENPDYLFFSVKSENYLNYHCVRIFFTAENIVPDFNICDYGIGFNYLDFGDRYIRFPLYLVDGFTAYETDDYMCDLSRALHKHEYVEAEFAEKNSFCSFVYSNGSAAKCRDEIFRRLSEYKTVDSGGKHLNNVDGQIDSKYEFQRKHKFVIAFENTSTPGYTTEKIVHAFSAGAVPIYWGNPEITREFNPGSFINCHDYGLRAESEDMSAILDTIAAEVARIDEDDEAYKNMLLTPAFVNKEYVNKMFGQFEEFLVNIFSQKKEDSFRRNRYYWGERYERKQRIGNKAYLALRRFIPVRNMIKRMLNR